MYRKLLPYTHKFVIIRQGMLGQMYMGRLLNVDANTLEIQTYHADGSEASQWTIAISTVTEFLTSSRQLDTLALRVKWLNSEETAKATDETPTTTLSDNASASKNSDSVRKSTGGDS